LAQAQQQPKPFVRRNRAGRVVILFLVIFGAGIIPTTAQTDSLPPLPDAALLADPVFARPGFAEVAIPYLNRTRYRLALSVDPVRGRIAGRAEVIFVNHSGVPLSNVIFRLYPNHPTHGARTMTIQSVTLDGSPTSGQTLDSDQTIYEIRLAVPLAVGGTAIFLFDYTITLPGAGFFYVSEPFPMVAVYDSSGWRTEVATNGLDYAYSESALYAVNLRAPTDVNTWFVGQLKASQPYEDGTSTYTIVTGPVRNFILIQARGWGSFELSGGPVPVRVLYAGNQETAQQIATIARDVFTFFEANFGGYPYAGFDVVIMRFPSGGEEYPGLVFINNERNAAYWRFIAAHEVAHQWFYGIAGNDTLRHAWLDESLAQIAGYLFYLKTEYAGAGSAATYWQSILTWYNRIVTVRPIDTPLDQYRDFADYMSTTYGGGAVFLRDLAEHMGVDAFIDGLRDYVREVNLGIGTPCQFYGAMQRQIGIDLREMFAARVGITC